MTFTPLGLEAPARADETLLDVARRAGVPLGNSCGATGICARCKVRVLAGADHLTPPTAIEIRFGTSRGFAPNERMACQSIILGDCEVTTTYW